MDLIDHESRGLRGKHRTKHTEVLFNRGWIRSQAIERISADSAGKMATSAKKAQPAATTERLSRLLSLQTR